MLYLDLTHTFQANMPVYPGDPLPELRQVAFVEKEDYNAFQVSSGMHVGTHMDAPLHMLAHGKCLSEYPTDHFFGRGHIIDARGQQVIEVSLLQNYQISKGSIVLILTGHNKKFRDPDYYKTYPEISTDFAAKMVELGVKIVGMDTPSPDKAPFRTHKLLLTNDVLIIENLTNLEQLLNSDQFEVIALPAKFDAEAAPARVVARLSSSTHRLE